MTEESGARDVPNFIGNIILLENYENEFLYLSGCAINKFTIQKNL